MRHVYLIISNSNMGRVAFCIFAAAIFFITALCEDSYAGSNIGITLDSNMQIVGFHHITGKDKKSPARKAGLREGDIVKEIEGIPVAAQLEYFGILDRINPGRNILVTVDREGAEETFEVKAEKDFSPEHTFVLLKSLEGEKIRLAIMTGKVSNAVATPGPQIEEWKDAIRVQLESEVEGVYIKLKNTCGNLSIVDRNRIKSILEELNFQASDYVSDETRTEIGRLTGASHILLINFSRLPKSTYSAGYLDMIAKRLIEVKTGEVISSGTVKQHYSSGGKLKKVE